MSMRNSVVIVGGGLAGLTAAILLRKGGLEVCLLEKNEYPFHRVCGEYVSNEVIPFLKENDLWPETLGPARISRFELTDTGGKSITMPLDLGGFGISRYALDAFFLARAQACGVEVRTGTRVEEINFENDTFQIKTRQNRLHAGLVIGAYGKRSRLDKQFGRSFINRRSPYVGVKYHIRNAPQDTKTVALHNFEGGYCGVNAVEDGIFNLCYLSHRSNLKTHGSIPAMEKHILQANPRLKTIMNDSEFLWDAPLVINEISFETKEPVNDHILMCGDAAGMITPLCGNGMAMAMHSAKILSETILRHLHSENWQRAFLENDYRKEWNKHFALRLASGRNIQRLFGGPFFSRLAVGIGRYTPPVARYLMSKTHGVPFS